MACNNVCKLCNNLVISESVTYDSNTNTLNITIPNSCYRNNQKVCIVIAQSIPATTTINALVYIFVNGSSFPLVKCNCLQATACELKTRTKYATKIVTDTISGSFKLLGNLVMCSPDTLSVLPTNTSTTTTRKDGGVE